MEGEREYHAVIILEFWREREKQNCTTKRTYNWVNELQRLTKQKGETNIDYMGLASGSNWRVKEVVRGEILEGGETDSKELSNMGYTTQE